MSPPAVDMIIVTQILTHTPIIIVMGTALYHLTGGQGHGYPIHATIVTTGLAPDIIMAISMDMDIFIMITTIIIIIMDIMMASTMAIGGDIMMGGGIMEKIMMTIVMEEMIQ